MYEAVAALGFDGGVTELSRAEVNSSVRISIEAPTGLTGLWSSTPTGGTATNTVHSDAARPSRLVLGVPAALAAPAERPACGEVRMQPCRASSAPVPPGSEDPLDLAAENQQSPASGGG